jgi:hypothetical protein
LEKDIDCIKSSSNKLSLGMGVVMGENSSSEFVVDFAVDALGLLLRFFQRLIDPPEPMLSGLTGFGVVGEVGGDVGDCTWLDGKCCAVAGAEAAAESESKAVPVGGAVFVDKLELSFMPKALSSVVFTEPS